MVTAAKKLGDMGESHAIELLAARGYSVNSLPTNTPTYDIKASNGSVEFFVSVKVSGEKQHVRLGSRASVERLAEGNFVFAFLPNPGNTLDALQPGNYILLILPAVLVREDSLAVHDAYWADKNASGGGREYSVMVKGYGHHHKAIWPKWLSYTDAWGLLPTKESHHG